MRAVNDICRINGKRDAFVDLTPNPTPTTHSMFTFSNVVATNKIGLGPAIMFKFGIGSFYVKYITIVLFIFFSFDEGAFL